MRPLLAWLADTLLGPRCPHHCGYRARGWRTLQAHMDAHFDIDHAGDPTPEGTTR